MFTNFEHFIKNNKILSITGGSLLVLLFMGSSFLYYSRTEMVLLHDSLSNDDMIEISKYLHKNGFDYEMSGDSILVEEPDKRKLRMLLAAEGLPNSGSLIGYEIFNNPDSFSTSSFTQNVNLIRALEGELSRTILTFDTIKSARVHLVIPKRELFSKNQATTTASVIIKPIHDDALSQKDIKSIINLIASAVQGLNPANITIVSTSGKSLHINKTDKELEDSTVSFNEYKLNLEKNMKISLIDLIGRLVGKDNVQIEIFTDLDFDKETVSIETYDPDGQVLRSSQLSEEKVNENENEGETDVSVANNIPNGAVSNSNSTTGSNTSKK